MDASPAFQHASPRPWTRVLRFSTRMLRPCPRADQARATADGSGCRPIGLSCMNPSPARIARTSGATSSASRAARTSPSAATGASARASVRSSTAVRRARPAAVSAPSAVQQPPPGQSGHPGRPLVLGPAATGTHPIGVHRDVGGEQHQRLDRIQAGGEQGGDVTVAPQFAQHRLGVPQHEVRRLRPGQGRVGRTERPARGRRGERGLAGERGGLGHGGRSQHVRPEQPVQRGVHRLQAGGEEPLRRRHLPRVGHRAGHESRGEAVEHRRDQLRRGRAEGRRPQGEVGHPVAARAQARAGGLRLRGEVHDGVVGLQRAPQVPGPVFGRLLPRGCARDAVVPHGRTVDPGARHDQTGGRQPIGADRDGAQPNRAGSPRRGRVDHRSGGAPCRAIDSLQGCAAYDTGRHVPRMSPPGPPPRAASLTRRQ